LHGRLRAARHPKHAQPGLERIELYVDRSTLTVRAIQVMTAGIDYSLELQGQKVGVTLPHGEFDLVPPPGYQQGEKIE
jgi:hypothetical protein